MKVSKSTRRRLTLSLKRISVSDTQVPLKKVG